MAGGFYSRAGGRVIVPASFSRGQHVIIECPSCHSKYQYDEARFDRKPSKKIKCARCQEIFDIHNPAFTPIESVKVDKGDSTYASKSEDLRRTTPQRRRSSRRFSRRWKWRAASARQAPFAGHPRRADAAASSDREAARDHRPFDADLTLNDTEARASTPPSKCAIVVRPHDLGFDERDVLRRPENRGRGGAERQERVSGRRDDADADHHGRSPVMGVRILRT